MIKIKSYWLRWWHCLYFGLTRIMTEDHRMRNEWTYDKISHIGCTCGKVFYHRKFIDIYNEVHNPMAKAKGDLLTEICPKCSKCKSPLIATNVISGQQLCGNKECKNYDAELIKQLLPPLPQNNPNHIINP